MTESTINNPYRYTEPEIEPRTQTKYDFSELRTLSKIHATNTSLLGIGPDKNDYPVSAKHSRVPVVINCQNCGDLTTTETEHENGFSNTLWCLFLSPFLCTGLCCICMDSCKDVKHKCTRCRKEVGVSKSACL